MIWTTRTRYLGAWFLACLLSACQTHDLAELQSATAVQQEFANAPSWVVGSCGSFWEGSRPELICGVGSASGTRNLSLARQAAIGRGRTEIARSLALRVKSMLKDYQASTTGGEEFGEAASGEQHLVDASKQITDLSLSGTEPQQSWVSPNGTLYVLVSLELDKFRESVGRMKSLSEQARKAIIERSREAFRELDREVSDLRAVEP